MGRVGLGVWIDDLYTPILDGVKAGRRQFHQVKIIALGKGKCVAGQGRRIPVTSMVVVP
jgi:hypothetical protein